MKKYCLDGDIAAFDYDSGDGIVKFCGPKSVKAFLAELKPGEKAEIEICSPGGDIVAGLEIANAVKNCSAYLIAHVTGMAASMASVIACACKEIVLEEASFVMLHDPFVQEFTGNSRDLRFEADLLDKMKDLLLSVYRSKFTCNEETLNKIMSDTTYMTAYDCIANGMLATVVKSEVRYAAKLTARDLSKAPESIRAFFKSGEIPESIKAEIDAARRAALEPAAPAAEATPDPIADALPEPAAPAAEASADPIADALPEPAAPAAEASADDWAARYKGASKTINKLQAKISELEEKVAALAVEAVDYGSVVAERDELKVKIASLEVAAAQAVEVENNLNCQLEKTTKDLLEAQLSISGLEVKLENSEKALVQSNQQLDHLKATRDLLTGGVLTPSESENSYAAKMAAAKTPEERESLRAQKRAGKIK